MPSVHGAARGDPWMGTLGEWPALPAFAHKLNDKPLLSFAQ
jgi:hypothetical protein